MPVRGHSHQKYRRAERKVVGSEGFEVQERRRPGQIRSERITFIFMKTHMKYYVFLCVIKMLLKPQPSLAPVR